ncbi:MAG: TIGR01777 family oxidoreductase, partial [Rikenellaceae bacterium]
ASGFIGSHLVEYFRQRRVSVVLIGRDLLLEKNSSVLYVALSGCNVVINLAGASISHRWTEEYKKEIYDSRIETTRILVNMINSLQCKPSLFISTSAVGFYPSHGSYTEATAQMDEGFLAKVCHDWEEQARRVCSEVRCLITRFGVVLSNEGGAFPEMIRTTKFKFATRFGRGEHFLSWISLHDLMRAYDFVIAHSELAGVINFCAPHPISGADFAIEIENHFHTKVTIPLPEGIIRKIFGEQSSLMLGGQRVYPERLLRAGFCFEQPTLKDFLKNY